MEANISIKVVVVGDAVCEKTKFCYEVITKEFPQESPSVVNNLIIKNYKIKGQESKIYFWNISGQEELDNIRRMNYGLTDLFIFLYSTTNKETLENLETRWSKEVKEYVKHPKISVIGLDKNKRDTLPENDVVKLEEAQILAERINAIYCNECDILDVNTVIQVFQESLDAYIDHPEPSKRAKNEKFCYI